MSSFEQKGNRITKYLGNDPEVVIPNGIEYLDDDLFSNAHNMEKVTIPQSVKRIVATMFPASKWGATSVLKEINVAGDNLTYKSMDGVVYSKDMTKIVVFPAGSLISVFKVPETVKEICKDAFQGCKNLKEVILPEGCERIEESAFDSCENLQHINLSRVKEIAERAFQECNNLQNVELDDADVIESWVFHGCWELQQVRFGNTVAIKEAAFSQCHKIKNLTLPNSLKTIDEYAFCGSGSIEVPKCVDRVGMCALESFQEITIYDNLRGEVSKMGKPYGNATGFSYDVFVKSAEDGSLKYVIPMHSDGTGKMYTLLMNAWNEDNSFDFNSVDRHFKSIKEPHIKTKMSMTRLAYPYSLSDEAKKDYEAYLKRNAVAIVKQFIDGATEKASFTGGQVDFSPHIKKRTFELAICWGLLKKTNINELIEYSQKEKNTEWTAFLLDWKAKNTSGKKGSPKLTAPSHLVGDEIVFGHYKWGDEDVPLEWIIVDITKKQYLLLSKYLLKEMPLYSEKRGKYMPFGWSKSDVRKWLNDEFYSTSFDISERERICQKKLKNINDDDTEDYLFVPSEKEFEKYIDLPGLVEEKLEFRYGTNRALGDTEMLRKTWKRYSSYCIELRTSNIWSLTNKPAYMHQYGNVTSPYYVRPMMWINKE